VTVLERLSLRDFRNYEEAEIELGAPLTLVTGPNGAGKTNLLEAVYFGCTARSPRTSNERELVRWGASVTRVELATRAADGRHTLEVGFEPGEPKRLRVDGHAVEALADAPERPLAGVFMPERLELVKGPPAVRRAHLDQLVAALWPGRSETRAAYSRALAQRNALLGRIRAGLSSVGALDAWDAELAQHGVRLMDDRREACAALAAPFALRARELGLHGGAELGYRPRSGVAEAGELVAELAERRAADLERGFTAHGPHRDDVALLLDGSPLRVYGSQGQQRSALLALLFAERDVLVERRPGRGPLMLLDDVMSELDSERRELLAELLHGGVQAILTATEPEHVPGAGDPGVTVLEVRAGEVALGRGPARTAPLPGREAAA
jgi:DNA replication and repair protein RecF